MNQHKESEHTAQSCRKQDESGPFVSTVLAAETCPGSLREAREAAEITLRPMGQDKLSATASNCPGKSPAEPLQARARSTRHGQEGSMPAPGQGLASPSSSTAALRCFPANFLNLRRSPPHAKKPRRHHIAEHQLHLPLAIGMLCSQLHIWDTSVQALWDQ